MAQQMNFFDVHDPSECDKPKPEMDDGTTPAHILTMGAAMCCKSKEVDQTVCTVDKCVAGMTKCLYAHKDFAAAEAKLTDPLAMDTHDDGIGQLPRLR